MKKNLFKIIAITATVLALTACGVEKTDEAKTEDVKTEEKAKESEIETVKKGVLTVATSPDFAPYEFYYVKDGKTELAGFDIELAKHFAEKLGLELNIIPMDFDSILLEVQNGNVDMGLAGFSPDPEREKAFDFSNIYYQGGQSFCINKENVDKYKSAEDMKGLSVAAQTGSIQYKLAEENTPDANLVGLPKVTDIVSELVNNKIDGAYIETPVAKQYGKNYPELVIAWDVPYEAEGAAALLKKGNTSLKVALDTVIDEVLEDGTMDKYISDAQALASDSENVIEDATLEEK